MHRRNILWGAISAFGAAFAASRASAAAEAAASVRIAELQSQGYLYLRP
jgi:uncharacterized protein